MLYRSVKWLAAALLALLALAVILIAVFGWNWARGPLQRITTEKTGRALVIGGDLNVSLGWPAPHVHTREVTFANPAWAKEKQMFSVEEVDFTIDLLELLRLNLVFPEVRLTRPVVFLEQAPDGRKTWLLDLQQSDETARIPIGRLTLDRGRIGYDDTKQNTRIRADISTQDAQARGADARRAGAGVVFNAKGIYKGLALTARGIGGSVLALHDESVPYPLDVEATVGHTGVKADGTITSLLKFVAMDMDLSMRGDSLAMLFPLLGIAFPETPRYVTAGHIVHKGQVWSYEKFTGQIGNSDIAGSLQVDSGGVRPFMRADLVSRVLDFADLGPLIGAQGQQRSGSAAQKTAAREPEAAAGMSPEKSARNATAATARRSDAPAAAADGGPHVLPDIPFKTERWKTVDADVKLRAGSILRAKALPLEDLTTRLKMQDSLLTVDPLDFGFAGGHLKAAITLDGRQDPIQARARIGARKILLAKLFPNVKMATASKGQINGDFNLAGKGNSVGDMLGTSDGTIGLLVADGEISRLLMEEVGLHLLEILQLKLTGDESIKLRCAVADFNVKSGLMKTNALVVDTDVNTVVGTGSVDLARERLDLTVQSKSRTASPVALRTPIYVKGTFSKPQIDIDKGRLAARSAGSILLGIINPLLALVPLVETGPGLESDCGRLIREVQASSPNTPVAAAAPRSSN